MNLLLPKISMTYLEGKRGFFFKAKAKSLLLCFALYEFSLNKLRCAYVKPGGKNKHQVKLMVSEDLQGGKTSQCNLS